MSADKAYCAWRTLRQLRNAAGKRSSRSRRTPRVASAAFREGVPLSSSSIRKSTWLHYHKRSNVESTFSAVKRKFGDRSAMSSSDTAMVNEVLCKLLCHNLTCLIQERRNAGHRAGVLACRASHYSSQLRTTIMRVSYRSCRSRGPVTVYKQVGLARFCCDVMRSVWGHLVGFGFEQLSKI